MSIEDSSIAQGLRRISGGTEVVTDEDTGEVRIESQMQADDSVLGTPISNTIKEAREDIQQQHHDTVFDLYDGLVELDGELSGAVNAIGQSATYKKITLPTDEPSSTEQEILEDCRALMDRIRGRETAIDVLRNLIKYGNDMNKKVYNDDQGIVALQSLPINSMTIVDDRQDLVTPDDLDDDDEESISDIIFQAHPESGEGGEELGESNIDEVFERDAYVLNEAKEDANLSIIEPWNVLHFSIDARSNWFEDRVGRETYGIWGQSRIEALKFNIQTKYNTLTNKVAMDDKLLAREIYYIDTEVLFGDIQDREKRIKKAEEYANDLAEMIEELGPDERPMLPEHVEVEVVGPEGKAVDQKPFIEQLNNGIAAALTFPMAGLGRGTTSVKAGEEISSLWAENNIKNLRNAVVRGFRELFRDQVRLTYPGLVENYGETENISQWKIDEDVSIPTFEYEPFREEDRSQIADQIETLVNIGVMTRAEAREEWGLPTDDESMNELEEQFKTYSSGGGGGPVGE